MIGVGLGICFFNRKGLTVFNILGKDGGCESLTGWTTVGTAPTVSTTQVKQGTYSFKCSPSSAQSYVMRDFTYPLDSAKQYILAGWVYIESYTSGSVYLRLNDVGTTTSRYQATIDISKVGQWQFVYVKIPTANALVGSGFHVIIGATSSTSTMTAYFDAIRLYELDLTTYNAIGTTYTASTSPSIDDILPYVDS